MVTQKKNVSIKKTQLHQLLVPWTKCLQKAFYIPRRIKGNLQHFATTQKSHTHTHIYRKKTNHDYNKVCFVG